jgi:hypothetical protein
MLSTPPSSFSHVPVLLVLYTCEVYGQGLISIDRRYLYFKYQQYKLANLIMHFYTLLLTV